MNTERFKKIEEIYNAAVEISPENRALFLKNECGDDFELKNEVELMLSFENSSGNFIDKHPEKLAAEIFLGRETKPDFVNQQIGRYKIRKILGEGGMGTVYLAEDTRLGRKVALKMLLPEMIRNKEHVRRFMHEARSASALNHPNILTVYEIDEFSAPDSETIHYISTEFVDGKTLHELIYSPKSKTKDLLEFLAQAAVGLSKAHSAGIVHRDLKPENIMVTNDGFAKILDFGLAKLTDTENELHKLKEHKSRSGVILGTLGYMSPEQALGKDDIDARSDIFSFGCILYEAVAKKKAFHAETTVDALYKIIHFQPKPLNEYIPGISAELNNLIEKCLKKDPNERFQNISEIAAGLQKLFLEDLDKTLQLVAKNLDTKLTNPTISRQFSNQRRQVTVMFADFSALSEFFEDFDPEESSRILQSFWNFLDNLIGQGGGKIGERLTDTFIAGWGTGKIYETDPENAVRTALHLQTETLNYFNKTISGEIDLSEAEKNSFEQAGFLKIGISTGHILFGNSGNSDNFLTGGAAVSFAKRLMTGAPVGEVFISHDTYRHIRGIFNVEEVKLTGNLSLKNKKSETKIYSIKSVKPRAFRMETRGVEGIETRIIGREGELSKLFETLQAVEEDRQLQTVSIVGEAGLGKSRLLFEFQDRIELLPENYFVFKARALDAMRGLPFSLIRELFSFRFEISENDSRTAAREKLVKGIAEITSGQTNFSGTDDQTKLKAHFIGQLIGFDFSESVHLKGIINDEKQIQERALLYGAQFFTAVSQRFPLIIYLDDLHWADDKSLDFIDFITQNCAEQAILIIETTRPTLFEKRPYWGEGQENRIRLDLQSLSKRESRKLIENILEKTENIPEELQNLIITNSAGNPFYVEELIKMFIEKGVIETNKEIWRIDEKRLGEITVPPTLTGVLESRLDKLSFWEKRILQRASVIGREFWDVSFKDFETEINIPAVLESLRAKELLFRKEKSAFGDSREYIFKHALLRDVTYETVLLEERRKWHFETAEWLIETSGEREREYLSVIAEHFEKAREFVKSAEWFGRAGHQALKSFASESAEGHFRKAIGYYKTVSAQNESDNSAELQLINLNGGLGRALYNQAKFSESIEIYTEMLEAAKKSGETSAQAEACLGINISLFENGNVRESLKYAEQLVELTKDSQPNSEDRYMLVKGLYRQGRTLLSLGKVNEAIYYAEKALEISNALEIKYFTAKANAFHLLSYANLMLGRFSEAEKFEIEEIKISRMIGDRRTLGSGLNSLGVLSFMRGDVNKAMNYFKESLEYARETGNKSGELINLNNIGGVLILLEEYERAEIQLKKIIEELGDRGHFMISETYRFLAESLIGQGKFEEALAASEKSLLLSEEAENQETIGEAWRIFGVISSLTGKEISINGNKFDAEVCFQKSLEIFEKNEMKANYAQTLHNLALYESIQGNSEKAHQLLKQVREISELLEINTEAKSVYYKNLIPPRLRQI